MIKCKKCEEREEAKKEMVEALTNLGVILNVFLGFGFSFVGFATIMYGICDCSALLCVCGILTIMYGISYVLGILETHYTN